MVGRDVRDLMGDVLRDIAPEVDLGRLDPTRSLRVQADLDSLDFLELLERLAERTGKPVREEDYEQLDTVAGCERFFADAAPDQR